MSNNPQNPFSIWTDMNKNMMDAWSAWTPKAAETESDTANPFAAYFDMFSNNFAQNPFFAFNTEGSQNMMEQLSRQWLDGLKNLSMFIPNQSVKDGYDRFLSSFQMFNGLQSFWDTYLKNIPTDITDWDTFMKPVMQYYQGLSGNLVSSFMPEQLRGVFTMPLDSLTSIQKAVIDFYKPWIADSAVMQGHLLKALQGDKEAYAEFLKAWNEVYKNSFSKLLNIPAVGANRAQIEKMLKMSDYYVNFVIVLNEFTAQISSMTSGATEKLIKHLAQLQADGTPPQTFMEFYKLWSKYNEQAFMDMYATDEFSKIMNETVSAGSKLQILYDDFMQDMLAFLPLPNRRELDDVEQEIYNLRNQVKAQAKEIKALKEQQAAGKKNA